MTLHNNIGRLRSAYCREEEAVNEAELSPEDFLIRKERMKAMREQVHVCAVSGCQAIHDHVLESALYCLIHVTALRTVGNRLTPKHAVPLLCFVRFPDVKRYQLA